MQCLCSCKTHSFLHLSWTFFFLLCYYSNANLFKLTFERQRSQGLKKRKENSKLWPLCFSKGSILRDRHFEIPAFSTAHQFQRLDCNLFFTLVTCHALEKSSSLVYSCNSFPNCLVPHDDVPVFSRNWKKATLSSVFLFHLFFQVRVRFTVVQSTISLIPAKPWKESIHIINSTELYIM